ncbi:ROK family protein [Risungbinella massiliensis]|uniref:ROK family protein n=1 Tax=Risungbinella massiliensis TaxID=1329796 RepID=UPI0005CBF4C9|nr:ROK family glucokinase [Risungbinella massiliensis]
MSKWIGIDLGGTNIKLGIINEFGEVLFQVQHPTRGKGNAEESIQQIIHVAQDLAKEAGIDWIEIQGIGFGLPGFLDIKKGIVKNLTNLFWKDVPIKARLEQAWGKPVKIENDANAAALGEAWSGAGKGVQDLVCITLGTGVGGGVIVNGNLVHGFSDSAGEIGHIVVDPNGVDCNCGKRGCLETISSATGIIRLAKEAMVEYGEYTKLSKAIEISPKTVFELAAQNDPAAKEVLEQVVEALAEVLSILSVVLNPARFVIGGGVALAGEQLLEPLRNSWKQKTDPHAAQGVEIVAAKLGNDAGMIGAAGLFV